MRDEALLQAISGADEDNWSKVISLLEDIAAAVANTVSRSSEDHAMRVIIVGGKPLEVKLLDNAVSVVDSVPLTVNLAGPTPLPVVLPSTSSVRIVETATLPVSVSAPVPITVGKTLDVRLMQRDSVKPLTTEGGELSITNQHDTLLKQIYSKLYDWHIQYKQTLANLGTDHAMVKMQLNEVKYWKDVMGLGGTEHFREALPVVLVDATRSSAKWSNSVAVRNYNTGMEAHHSSSGEFEVLQGESSGED